MSFNNNSVSWELQRTNTKSHENYLYNTGRIIDEDMGINSFCTHGRNLQVKGSHQGIIKNSGTKFQLP
jgi:hypothetical protein